MQTLCGHVSPESSYVVADYPYGYRLRCQIRYWLEHKPRHGFRLVSQTTNPKKPGTVWNRPKAGTYHDCAVMVLDDDGRVTYRTLSAGWSDEATIAAFERLVGFPRLRLIHANDSRKERGSRVDRHAHIGQGEIGEQGFRLLLTDPRLASVPVVLETPKKDEMDRVNLATLRRLAAA